MNKENNSRQLGERLLQRKLAWTKQSIFFENLWLRLWPLFIVLSLFLIATLFGFWSILSPLLHRVLLALFIFAGFFALYPLLSLRWPKEKEALKRLDKNSVLPHQPAQAFKDQLASKHENKKTTHIWVQFKERLVEKIKGLRVPFPQPNTAKKDPFALRIVLVVLVVLGLFFQQGNLAPVLSNSIKPPPLFDTKSIRIDAWVTPPNYIDQPPLMVSNGAINQEDNKKQDAFKVTENSILTIRVNGTNTERLTIETDNNLAEKKEETQSDIQSHEFTIKLTKTGLIHIKADEVPLQNWNFNVIEDSPPIIDLIASPAKAPTGALKLNYKIVDDYGVVSANAHIVDVKTKGQTSNPDLLEEQKPLGTPPEFALNLPEVVTKEGKDETFQDLTRHPWAGLVATLYLTAKDEGGNTSRSSELVLKLPAYTFTKPLARKIILSRQQLIIAPHKSKNAAQSLYDLTADKTAFENKPSIFSALDQTAGKLLKAGTRKEKEHIAEVLYDLARRVEDGNLSKAQQALRAAQDALRNALRNNASSKDIEKRIEELRQAYKDYLKAVSQQASNDQQQPGQNKESQNRKQKDFEQMLKAIEQLSKSGSKKLAEQLLSKLQNMLENTQTGADRQSQQNMADAKNLKELGKLMREQQELMDKTFQQNPEKLKLTEPEKIPDPRELTDFGKLDVLAPITKTRMKDNENFQNYNASLKRDQQSKEPNNQPRPDPSLLHDHKKLGSALAKEQQKLQDKLEKLLRGMGKGNRPGALNRAKKAMQQAQKKLKTGNLKDAVGEEGKAVLQIRKGMDEIATRMIKEKGKGGIKTDDPLGNNPTKRFDTSDSTKVPDEFDIQRTKEILQSLQEKLEDPNRRILEIEYFERLLNRFN